MSSESSGDQPFQQAPDSPAGTVPAPVNVRSGQQKKEDFYRELEQHISEAREADPPCERCMFLCKAAEVSHRKASQPRTYLSILSQILSVSVSVSPPVYFSPELCACVPNPEQKLQKETNAAIRKRQEFKDELKQQRVGHTKLKDDFAVKQTECAKLGEAAALKQTEYAAEYERFKVVPSSPALFSTLPSPATPLTAVPPVSPFTQSP